jgi:hypothetical protein
MAYRANPFLERMSERTTSDQEFVQLFAPKILEKLNEDCFEGAVHVFHSPPGGEKPQFCGPLLRMLFAHSGMRDTSKLTLTGS